MEMVFFFFERAVHPFWGKAHTRTNQGSEVRDGAVVGLSQQLTYTDIYLMTQPVFRLIPLSRVTRTTRNVDQHCHRER
jgi:hypothetical protein